MNSETKTIKELRKLTGAPILDCKEVLLQSDGDMEKAKVSLLERGFSRAQKRAGRLTTQGMIASYIHHDGNMGVLAEVNCETDFVAKNEVFRELAKEIAMQIAACSPLYISREDIPDDVLNGVPENKREERFRTWCLLDQPYIKDESSSVRDLIARTMAKIGENIRVSRFVRYKIGEASGQECKEKGSTETKKKGIK